MRISEGGNALFITNESTGKTYLAQGSEFDDTGSKPLENVPVLGALVANPSQSLDDVTITTDSVSFITTAVFDRVLKDFTVYFSQATTEVSFALHSGPTTTGPIIIDAVFDAVVGANLITFDSNPRLQTGNEYTAVISTTNPSLNIQGSNIDDGIHGTQFFTRNDSNSWPYAEVTAASSASSVTLFTDVTDAGSGQIITIAERTKLNDDSGKILYTVEQASSLPTNATNGVFALVTVGVPAIPKGIYEKHPAGWNVRLGVSTTTINVINNLTSTSTTDALSANQGRELKLLLDNNSNFKQFVTLRANLVAGSELDYAIVSPGVEGEPAGIYQSLSSVWALVLDMSSIGDTNIQSDWDQTDNTQDNFIENKPVTITQAQTDKLASITSVGSGAIISANERAIINSVRLDDVAVFQAHTFVVGNVIYHDGRNWVLAQADTVATAAALGVVTTVDGSSIFTVTLSGFSTELTGLSPGGYLLPFTNRGGYGYHDSSSGRGIPS